MVGNGVGAKKGILFKNATSLETTGKTQIVALVKQELLQLESLRLLLLLLKKKQMKKNCLELQ